MVTTCIITHFAGVQLPKQRSKVTAGQEYNYQAGSYTLVSLFDPPMHWDNVLQVFFYNSTRSGQIATCFYDSSPESHVSPINSMGEEHLDYVLLYTYLWMTDLRSLILVLYTSML